MNELWINMRRVGGFCLSAGGASQISGLQRALQIPISFNMLRISVLLIILAVTMT